MAIWEGDEREGVMTVVPAEGFAGKSGYFDESSGCGAEHAAPELECERCEKCGAPKGVSRLFVWEQDGCRIEERFSGRRYCFNNTRGITAVLRMLVEELGEDIEQKIVEISANMPFALEDIVGKPEGNGGRGGMDLVAHLEQLPFAGMGKGDGRIQAGGCAGGNGAGSLQRDIACGQDMGDAGGVKRPRPAVSGQGKDGTALRLTLSPA